MRNCASKIYNNRIDILAKVVYVFSGLLCIGALFYSFSANVQNFSLAADVVDNLPGGIIMRTQPELTFFNIQDMVPGEQKNEYLTIFNDGQVDFSYKITSSLLSGSDELFKVLDLKITGSDGRQIYIGKMKNLNNISLGSLCSGNNETLCFNIGFPRECGNEYQNLNTKVNFLINAEENPIMMGVVWEPPLEEADVNTRNGLIMPIRFHLLNNNVYDTVKRGVELEISGVDANDKPVLYIFKVTDGTLLWQDSSQSPHYELPSLDTVKYPIKPDSYYTATVKYGDRMLGSTRFMSGH